jgi:acetyl esterase
MKFNTRFFAGLILSLCLPFAVSAADPKPDMKSVLDEMAALGAKPLETLSPAEARLQPGPGDAVRSLLAKRGKVPNDFGITNVRDVMIAGAAGDIPARVYIPAAGALPVILYFHGGGWVIGDRDAYDSSARALAKKVNAMVISVDYRRAPEAKFPAAHDDAVAAYKWVVANAQTLGADPTRIAVAGESAGGNLALNVVIAARDQGLQLPRHALVIYPVAQGDMNSKSYRDYAPAKPLSQAMMAYFFATYLNSPAEMQDPRINLVGANLKNLPATTVITAEIDPLRSEGQKLGQLLKDQGVAVTQKNYVGMTHEFFGLADIVTDAGKAQDFAAGRLKAALAK